MTRAPAPSAFLRRLVIVAATAAMAAVGWFLLDEPDAVGAAETVPAASAHEVLARVAGHEITHDQIRDAARDELDSLDRQVRERRRQILERSLEAGIADLLLDAEAHRRGLDREALLEAEVDSKLGLVSDDAVEALREDLRENLRENSAEADEEAIRRQLRREAFLEELRSRHPVEVYGERLAGLGS